MSDLVRCDSCEGKKNILSLGGMYKQCQPCLGIGWIAAKKVDIYKAKEQPKSDALQELKPLSNLPKKSKKNKEA